MPARFVDRRALETDAELDDTARQQLAAIGTLYFGDEGDVSIGDIAAVDDPMEQRTLVACSRWSIVDGARHLYDAWFYMVDSGTIFEAGTVRPVAQVIQCGLECDDPALRHELGAAMVEAKLLPPQDGSYAEFSDVLAKQSG